MDTNLPNLDIVEDIKEIMNDDVPDIKEVENNDILNENQELEDNSPFVKPKKEKRELSDKQKSHLEKIRVLAVEKKNAKSKAKKEAMDIINKEHKAKSYKSKEQLKLEKEERKLEREEKKLAKQKYKEKTIKINDEIKENDLTKTSDDFIPIHKEEKKQEKINNDISSFSNFMNNMENYLKLRDDFERKKQPIKKQEDKQKKTKKEEIKPQAIKQQPINLITTPDNPYINYFG